MDKQYTESIYSEKIFTHDMRKCVGFPTQSVPYRTEMQAAKILMSPFPPASLSRGASPEGTTNPRKKLSAGRILWPLPPPAVVAVPRRRRQRARRACSDGPSTRRIGGGWWFVRRSNAEGLAGGRGEVVSPVDAGKAEESGGAARRWEILNITNACSIAARLLHRSRWARPNNERLFLCPTFPAPVFRDF
jgi:hypothetical protein